MVGTVLSHAGDDEPAACVGQRGAIIGVLSVVLDAVGVALPVEVLRLAQADRYGLGEHLGGYKAGQYCRTLP